MASTDLGVSAAEASGNDGGARWSALDSALFEELWVAAQCAAWGLSRGACEQILEEAGLAANFGLAEDETPNPQQQAAYLRGLCLADLVLARACAAGHEGAWAHFIEHYRQPLHRAAVAITRSTSLGQELADQLYAELYGLHSRDGARRCPLMSYRGRGSLMGWLRTTLAQRHVDHCRRIQRETPLEEADPQAQEMEPAPYPDQAQLAAAVQDTLAALDAEDRFLLAAYYLDGRTMLQLAATLNRHEATISRRLRKTTDRTRKMLFKNLQRSGLSRRAAAEALEIDPRDVEVDLKKILQSSQRSAFPEKAEA